MNATLKTGLSVAAAAAALFATTAGVTTAAAADGMVRCSGVNSCKGTSECKTAKERLQGPQQLQGPGLGRQKSADRCTKAGGKVEIKSPVALRASQRGARSGQQGRFRQCRWM